MLTQKKKIIHKILITLIYYAVTEIKFNTSIWNVKTLNDNLNDLNSIY